MRKSSTKYITDLLYHDYIKYKEHLISEKRFKHAVVKELIAKHMKSPALKIEQIGSSIEDREIYMVTVGKGPVKILAWSQMHGDESTATMALFDLFNFFSAKDEYMEFKEELLEKVTIYFIPMLNPDGAERFQRWNAINVDLNRDAISLQSEEAKLLKSVRENLKPEFGFNLHDQNSRYTTGHNYKSAAISFLAPPFNLENEIDQVRENAMKVITIINEELSKLIPGHIGRYDDEFEPRAFGDNFIKWGTSSILIESGGWKDDPQKQFLRELNFIALLAGINSIAEESYKTADTAVYFNIPENKKFAFDVLFKNVNINTNKKQYTIDIGVNLEEIAGPEGEVFVKGTIEECGDLTGFFGYEEYDCTGMDLEPGKVYPDTFDSYNDLEQTDFHKLHREGYTTVRLRPKKIKEKFCKLPVNIISARKEFSHRICSEEPANFVITKNNKAVFAVVNGLVRDLKLKKNTILNGIVIC